MRTLDQVKEIAAKYVGYINWQDLVDDGAEAYHWPEIAKDYARQVAEQALRDAADNANIDPILGGIDKDSILYTEIKTP